MPMADDSATTNDGQTRVGIGGIGLRPMTPGDVADGMRLKNLAGWNQLERDWSALLALGSGGCFAAVAGGRVVGTVTTAAYGDRIAWIGMMLVDPQFRRRGIAGRLMEQAVDFAAARCASVGLDATPEGRPVYEKLAFRPMSELVRLTIPCVPEDLASNASAAPLNVEDLDAATLFDAEAFGADRGSLLMNLRQAAPQAAWLCRGTCGIDAICLGRPGAYFHQIGPVNATAAATACAVTANALAALRGRPAVIDAPRDQRPYLQWLLALGFSEQRSFTRMLRGAVQLPGRPSRQFAIAGPELG